MKVTIKDDQNTEMLSIEVDGVQIECGNYWDFNVKRSIVNVLNALNVGYEIDNTWDFEDE